MELTSQRRKACDLCFTKKIKCDMLKPHCSNCLLYKSECKTTRLRRRTAAAKDKLPRPAQNSVSSRESELEARLALIENQLKEVLEASASQPVKSQQPPVQQPVAGPFSPSQVFETPSPEPQWLSNIVAAAGQSPVLMSGWDTTTPSDWVAQPEPMVLPPLEDVLPLVNIYFTRFNIVMPLFHQGSFMTMLSDWYSHVIHRTRPAWAAINIVLAIAHRACITSEKDFATDGEKSAAYLRNAQTVVNELVTREEDLVGLQVLLGMSLLFLGTKNPKPASVLLGTTIRLAHRMGLHDQDRSNGLPEHEAVQRARIFWVAYYLDKDVSLNQKMPSFQVDADIDLPLPDLDPADNVSIMYSTDSTIKFNYFRSRTALSHIQGKIYDLLYSTRSKKASPEDRVQRREQLNHMLEQWRLQIPEQFQMANVASSMSPTNAVHMVNMYSTYMLCLVHAHGIYTFDMDETCWFKEMRQSMTACDANGTISESCKGKIPAGWENCVVQSRAFIQLFTDAPFTECGFWISASARFATVMMVLTQMFIEPMHPHLTLDRELTRKAVAVFDQMVPRTTDKEIRWLHEIVSALFRQAMAATQDTVEAFERQAREQAQAQAAADYFVALGNQMGNSQLADDFHFMSWS
ncbi:ABC-transporter-regulating transcription factor like protein [Verticillium longisporum]|nr:ABC-transporter-regulating transcription factor like protein [Verticillium longisporum]